jgi:hypothetical protein
MREDNVQGGLSFINYRDNLLKNRLAGDYKGAKR